MNFEFPVFFLGCALDLGVFGPARQGFAVVANGRSEVQRGQGHVAVLRQLKKKQ